MDFHVQVKVKSKLTLPLLATGVNDTVGKFTAGAVDSGGKCSDD